MKEYKANYTLKATQWNKEEDNISIVKPISKSISLLNPSGDDGEIFVEGKLFNCGEFGDIKIGESTWYISHGDYVVWNDDGSFREVIRRERFEKLYE